MKLFHFENLDSYLLLKIKVFFVKKVQDLEGYELGKNRFFGEKRKICKLLLRQSFLTFLKKTAIFGKFAGGVQTDIKK